MNYSAGRSCLSIRWEVHFPGEDFDFSFKRKCQSENMKMDWDFYVSFISEIMAGL